MQEKSKLIRCFDAIKVQRRLLDLYMRRKLLMDNHEQAVDVEFDRNGRLFLEGLVERFLAL